MQHISSHRAPCSCFAKKVSLQLLSEQSVGDVWIAQLEQKRVPQTRSSGWKSSVAVTAESSLHHTSWNISRPQRAPSAVILLSHTRQQSSAMERATSNYWRTRHATLNLTRSWMGSQWNSCSTGLMWSRRRLPVISRAVAFCTDCNLCSRVSDRP